MKKVFTSLAIVLLCVLAVPTLPAKAAAKLNQTKVVAYVGDQAKVYMRGTNRHVTWTTSDSKVATVKYGKITAKKQGTAVVTAKVGSKKYTCNVTVKGTAISSNKATLTAGKSLKLKLNGADHKVYWYSNNHKVATVWGGRVYAKKAGTVTITAKCNGKKYRCQVTVKKPAKKVVKKVEKTQVIKVDKKVINDKEMQAATKKYLKKLVIKNQKTRGSYVYYTVTKSSYQALQKDLKKELNSINSKLVKNYKGVTKVTYNNSCSKVKIYVNMNRVRSFKSLKADLEGEAMALTTQMTYIQAFNGVSLNRIHNNITIYNARNYHVAATLVK